MHGEGLVRSLGRRENLITVALFDTELYNVFYTLKKKCVCVCVYGLATLVLSCSMRALERKGSVVVVGLSCSMSCGFPSSLTGLNPRPLAL